MLQSLRIELHMQPHFTNNHILPNRPAVVFNFTYLHHLLTHSLTYLLTAWCRVLLEKLTGLYLVKKFPAFHGTRRFITALTSVRHLSLSWASPIQSIYPHPTSWSSILILSTHLRLGLPRGPLMPYQNKVGVRFFGLTLGSLSSATHASSSSSSSPQGPTSLRMMLIM